MKFQAIPIDLPDADPRGLDAELIRLKVSGPVDPDDAVMVRARALVLGTGSRAMLESFDWAVQSGSFVSDE